MTSVEGLRFHWLLSRSIWLNGFVVGDFAALGFVGLLKVDFEGGFRKLRKQSKSHPSFNPPFQPHQAQYA